MECKLATRRTGTDRWQVVAELLGGVCCNQPLLGRLWLTLVPALAPTATVTVTCPDPATLGIGPEKRRRWSAPHHPARPCTELGTLRPPPLAQPQPRAPSVAALAAECWPAASPSSCTSTGNLQAASRHASHTDRHRGRAAMGDFASESSAARCPLEMIPRARSTSMHGLGRAPAGHKHSVILINNSCSFL